MRTPQAPSPAHWSVPRRPRRPASRPQPRRMSDLSEDRMSATATGLVPSRPKGVSWLWRRQLEHYPETGARVMYLAITVLATVMLYYELYVGGSVSTLILSNLHMSFTFYVITLAFGNLIGAFGSLFAGLTDRWGRANLVVIGLFLTAIFTLFILPAATDKWVFTIEGFIIGTVEGICLVATPALSPRLPPAGRRAPGGGFRARRPGPRHLGRGGGRPPHDPRRGHQHH